MSPNEPPHHDPFSREFPKLEIVTPGPARRSESERYGALFYLGIGGLVITLALLAWFAWGVWEHRSLWVNTYTLHDTTRPESERLGAAYDLAHDPGVNQRQLWDIALRKDLPPLARYVVAEALTAEAASADPQGYALSVARSEGWPDWLRLLLLRPLAYRVAFDLDVARGPVEELASHKEPAIALLAAYALAEGSRGDPKYEDTIRKSAQGGTPSKPLAALLARALDASKPEDRLALLDEATHWLRDHQPDAAALWKGWQVVDGHLVPRR